MSRARQLSALVIRIILVSLLAPALAGAQDNSHWWEGFHPPGVMKGSYKGKVNVIVQRDGQVYVGGDFDRIGLVDAANIARWDGYRWHPLGEGVNGEVTTIYPAQTALFVAGNFTAAGGEPALYVARWTENQWYRMGDEDFDGHVYAFEYHNTTLYAGGNFTHYGATQMWHLAKWVGSEWERAESTGPVCYVCWPSQIRALKSYGSRLWVGGTFDSIDGTNMFNIAAWDEDNGYQELGTGPGIGPHSGYPTVVDCFEDQVGYILFGGQFLTADSDDCLGLGSSASGETLHGITPFNPADYWVNDLVDLGETTLVVTDKWLRSYGAATWGAAKGSMVGALCAEALGSTLYAGGELIASNTHADGIAYWNGYHWFRVGAGLGYRADFGDKGRTLTTWEGDLFVGGENTGVRSVSYDEPDCPGTMLYDGSSLRPLSPGLAYTYDSIVYQDQLYVGGEFNPGGGLAHVARREGDAWMPLGTGIGPSAARVNALTEWNGLLVMAGHFSSADGLVCDRLVAWDGAAFSLVDDAVFSGDLLAVCDYQGDLIVGGYFNTLDGAAMGRVARWDGASWDAMNGGFNGALQALGVWGGALYAGGEFTLANGVAVNGIARWDGAAWQPVGGGVDATVYALHATDHGLFVGGNFTQAGGAPAAAVARWNGGEWNPLGDGLTGGPLTPTVRDFAERNGHLYMTGNFLYAGGKLSAGLARWDQGSTGVVDDPVPAPAAPTLAVWPNPANPRFNVELRMPSAQPVRLTVLDVSGRHLATLHEGALDEGDHVFTWDGRDDAGRPLASGVYLLGLTGPAGSQGKRLVLLR